MKLIRAGSYYLEPGYVYFSKQPTTLRAVVGSCVAVCLYDRILQMGGMNHYLRPHISDQTKATPQYGNVAISALVRMMDEAGSRRRDVVAQVLGGGAPEDAQANWIGDQNVSIAREILARKGIRIVSEDVGGSVGRKIVFDTGTGEIAVLKVQKLRSSDWYT
ncbi:MAG: chemotaxis protein CheD [Candidatus Hydrogenedentes bacterium]|nr:chemotaxis protein CheD [Candidatus Hydrogenedentota bacterium]